MPQTRAFKVTLRILSAILALWAIPRTARGDDPKYEFKQPPPPEEKPLEKPTLWKANLQLGALLVFGNAESAGISGTSDVSVKHYNNQVELFVQGAYAWGGTTSVKGGPIDGHDTLAANWLARLRYDRYFFKYNTVFASFQTNGDLLGGILYRLEPQVGYARIFFQSIHQTFRGEIGYDYAFEHYLAGSMPEHSDFHSARLFLFYENKFTPYASFSEGLELLEAVNRAEHFRLNSLTSLSSTVSKRVALKLNFTIKYNNDPPLRPTAGTGQFEKLDTLLEAVLAVTFL